jgi:hypothetical protein
MAITVKHSKVSTIPDEADTSLVRPSDWNADHTLVGTIDVANGGTGATTLTGYVKGNGTSAMTASATVPNTDITGLGTMSTQNSSNINVTGGSISGTTVSGYIPTADEGVANGVATLDSGGKVPVSQLPAAVLGALSYQGTWDASTNTPTLTSSVGTKGYYYVVSVAGNTNLNGITDWLVGDWAVFNGTVWQKVDNTDAVTSVNGLTGAVVLTTTNVAEGTNLYYTDARSRGAISAGTGISYNSTTGVITNSSPSLGGDVVGPATATDNAIARYDTTTGKLIQNSTATISDAGLLSASSVTTTGDSTIHGLTVGKGNSGVSNNTAFGVSALAANTTGQQNVGVGTSALSSATTANNQVAVGYQVLRLSNAADNTGVGSTALQSNTSGSGNVAVGFQTLTANTTGGSNTALGKHALITNSTGSNLTALGNHAGAYETGSNALYIDAIDRTNTAGDKAGALLYGTFNATPSNQTLVINGKVTLPYQTDFNAALLLAGSAGTSGQVLTSAGTGATPTWTTATTGTVTSVGGTGTVNGITLTGTVTSSGNLTLGGTLSGVSLATQVTGTLPIANGGTGETTRQAAIDALAGAVTSGQYLRGNGTDVVMSAIQAADVPTLNQNTTGSAGSVANALTAGTGLTATATFNGSAAITFNATGTTINSQTSAYTLVAADAGKTISITTGGVTIPNAVMAAGNIVTIYNNSGSSQTITQGASLTLQWAGQSSSSTGNRTVGLYGIVTILFISSSVAVISGAGLS